MGLSATRTIGAGGDGTVQGQESRLATHHLDEEQTLMAAGGVADAVHTPHDGVQCCVIADRVIGTCQVVVDGAGYSHDGEIKLAGKLAGAAQRTVTANDHQRVDAMLLDDLISLFAAFHRLEILATGGLQDGTAMVHDAGNTLGLQVNDLIFYQTPVAAVDAFYLKSVVNCRSGDRADGSVHARRVAS